MAYQPDLTNPTLDIVVSAEPIWDRLKRNNLLPENGKLYYKALACNFLDFDDQRLFSVSKHINILKIFANDGLS